MELVRVAEIICGTSSNPCPIPNFCDLGIYKNPYKHGEICNDPVALDDEPNIECLQKPPVRGVSGQKIKNSHNQESEITKPDHHKTEQKPRTVSELREVLRISSNGSWSDPSRSRDTITNNKTKTTKKKTTKAPLPPAAAYKFVEMMLERKDVKDIALAVSPNQINGKKRKRSCKDSSTISQDLAADIFNEDRLSHIHGWVELQSGEKKSFYVLHYQPLMLDLDVKGGSQYDELAFWIELRPSVKDGISAIHSDKVDWFVVENSLSEPKFFICDRVKLCEYLYTKLPDKGTTTNNPFESVYKIYREGRKLQLKTRMPFNDLQSEKLIDLSI